MAYPNICKNLFQPSTQIFRGFTTGLSRIIAIMFVWNPPESIGFLFLIISKMTLMSALHIRSMSKPLKARKRHRSSACSSFRISCKARYTSSCHAHQERTPKTVSRCMVSGRFWAFSFDITMERYSIICCTFSFCLQPL